MTARGLRGDYAPRPGDITGARFLANADVKADHEQAIRATRNALSDEPIELIKVGPRVYAIPKVIARAIRNTGD